MLALLVMGLINYSMRDPCTCVLSPALGQPRV